MSKDTLVAKYEALPVAAQKQVETFIEFLSKTTHPKPAHSNKRRFRFDWAGGLADLKDRFTAVELHTSMNCDELSGGHQRLSRNSAQPGRAKEVRSFLAG
jgi:hypothetical protein